MKKGFQRPVPYDQKKKSVTGHRPSATSLSSGEKEDVKGIFTAGKEKEGKKD